MLRQFKCLSSCIIKPPIRILVWRLRMQFVLHVMALAIRSITLKRIAARVDDVVIVGAIVSLRLRFI